MAESRTVETLRNKAAEIASAITAYEERIAQARVDLAHVNATIALLVAGNEGAATRAYVNIQSLFKRGELIAMAKATLADGPANTRELCSAILKAKGLDPNDRVLGKAIGHRLIHALRLHRRTGKLVGMGRSKAAIIWRLPETLV